MLLSLFVWFFKIMLLRSVLCSSVLRLVSTSQITIISAVSTVGSELHSGLFLMSRYVEILISFNDPFSRRITIVLAVLLDLCWFIPSFSSKVVQIAAFCVRYPSVFRFLSLGMLQATLPIFYSYVLFFGGCNLLSVLQFKLLQLTSAFINLLV